jgi:ATP-binding cassette subfamily F protein 3
VLRNAGTLSGGERARVALAMMMLSGANFLIFDEPTNHLDVESIESLEDAIQEYDGTVLLVSHDRELLRTLVDRVWLLHDMHITDFDGTFAEWEVVSNERAHAAAVNASEEESLRRMHEKQKTKRREDDKGRNRDATRSAKQRAATAEKTVEEIEGRIATLTASLGDPELYTTAEGKKKAVHGGKELEQLKKKLDKALEEWTEATEEADRQTAGAR